MPKPEVWGPPTWTLLHTLLAKLDEDGYRATNGTVLGMVRQLCAALPCPDCSTHATGFLAKLRPEQHATRRALHDALYCMHNWVNVRNRKPLFDHSLLDRTYAPLSLGRVVHQFASVYHTRGNMQQLAESFRREVALSALRAWLGKYGALFTHGMPLAVQPTDENKEEEDGEQAPRKETEEATPKAPEKEGNNTRENPPSSRSWSFTVTDTVSADEAALYI